MATSNPSSEAADEQRRRFRRAVAVVGISTLGLSALVAGAVFTDTESITANTFSTGGVDISVSPATAAITMTGMTPGDTVTAAIAVSNTGTLAHRYSVLSTTDATDANFLAAQLQMTVKVGVTTCTNAGFAGSGTVLYGPGVLGSTAGTKVMGDAAQGQHAGDRSLIAGASETLCAQVTLPLSTPNTYQNKTTTATLRFDAEQTSNNP